MSLRPRGVWLTATLTAVAVLAPCTAWYVVGSASADREAAAIRARPHERGAEIARGLAERLVGRLEAMRDGESERPLYHFQSSYHDPTSTCQCASRTPSPLATGSRDPFVEVHFQIDPRGQLGLPLLDPESAESPDADRLQRAVERGEQLEASATAIREMVAAQLGPAVRPDAALLPATNVNHEEEWHLESVADDPWLQIEDLQWYGTELGGEPSLTALRRVATTQGDLIQGFVLSTDAIGEWLRSAELPAVLRPRAATAKSNEAIADVPLDCTVWEVAVDVTDAVAEAELRADTIQAGFYRSFGIGSIAALLAGLSVILLVASADRSSRQRARFAASAAHELRTPLTGMRLYGEMLETSLDDPEKVARYAGHIAAESQRLSRVVTNVLGFTRLEQGEMTVYPEDLDLRSVAREAIDRLRPAIEGQGASLELEVDEDTPGVHADRDALEHILQNLVDNAEKFSRDAGDRRIHIDVSADRDGPYVDVRDHGPGIPPAMRQKIFEPFFRGDAKDGPAGLGLGLSLVRQLVRAHGEEVQVSDAPGGGTRFRVRFPLTGSSLRL